MFSGSNREKSMANRARDWFDQVMSTEVVWLVPAASTQGNP